jgi:hypothetical protein
MRRDRVKTCAEVCESLAVSGVYPNARQVRAEWVRRYGAAPSFTDLLPVLRKWVAKRRNSRRVKSLLRSYGRLDPVERGAFVEVVSQSKEGTAP